MAGRLVKGELLVTGISALKAPLSSFHLKAVQPHGCGALVPQLNVPLGPRTKVAVLAGVMDGDGAPSPPNGPEIAMPCGSKPPRLSPPKPAPMAGEPGRSCAAWGH